MKLLFFTIMIFASIASSSTASAANCPCDATSECGDQPSTCFSYEASSIDERKFVEEDNPHPTILTLGAASRGMMDAYYGSPLDGIPGGTFRVIFTGQKFFKLMLISHFDGRLSIVDHFKVASTDEGGIVLKRVSDGAVFLEDHQN